jgi:TatA/E family protein of Tat protein translocase
MLSPHPIKLLVALLVALLIFGPRRLPEVMGSLGRGLRQFKDSMSEEWAGHSGPEAGRSDPGHDDPWGSKGRSLDDERDEALEP